MVMDDELSAKIMEKSFTILIGLLLRCHPINIGKIEFDDINSQNMLKASSDLQLHCLQLLRYLFSIEKNRKNFKTIFPPKIFGIFIDIGNYVKVLNKYEPILNEFNKLNEKEIEKIKNGLASLVENNPANAPKIIEGFSLIDCLVNKNIKLNKLTNRVKERLEQYI